MILGSGGAQGAWHLVVGRGLPAGPQESGKEGSGEGAFKPSRQEGLTKGFLANTWAGVSEEPGTVGYPWAWGEQLCGEGWLRGAVLWGSGCDQLTVTRREGS